MKLDLDKVHTMYFLGIGGIGMSALARYFSQTGKVIYGYDLTPSTLTKQLEKEGMSIRYDEGISNLPTDIDLVIHTPAIPKSHPIYLHLEKKNTTIKKRSEILGCLSFHYFTVAIAGTHGKTSISAITAHILKSAGKKVTAFVGGIMKNYNSNLIVSEPTDYLIAEADEFDHSFLSLFPDISLVSSIDADHLDIYGTHDELISNFKKFIDKSTKDGTLILNQKIYSKVKTDGKLISYGTDETSDFNAKNIRIIDGQFCFDLSSENLSVKEIKMAIPGQHYVENALGAAAIAAQLGLSAHEIKSGLESFKGVERRFDFRIKRPGLIYIDDYAHHPEEINATVKAARSLFPGKKITGIFQPHLYSRTRDFAYEFAGALDKLDEVILLEIYPAREKPIEGVSSEIILSNMQNPKKKLMSGKEVIDHLEKEKPEVLLTMGAGDIGLMTVTIERLLKK